MNDELNDQITVQTIDNFIQDSMEDADNELLEDADFDSVEQVFDSMSGNMNGSGEDGWGCSIQIETTKTLPAGDKAYVFDIPVQGNHETVHELTFGIPQGADGKNGKDGAGVSLSVKGTVGLSPKEKAFVLDEIKTVDNVTFHELTFGIPEVEISSSYGTAMRQKNPSSSIEQLEAMLPSLVEEWESNMYGLYTANLYFNDGTSIKGLNFASYSAGVLVVNDADTMYRINIRRIGLIEVIPENPIAGSMPEIEYDGNIHISQDEIAMLGELTNESIHTLYTIKKSPIQGRISSKVPGLLEVHIEEELEFITAFYYIRYDSLNGISV